MMMDDGVECESRESGSLVGSRRAGRDAGSRDTTLVACFCVLSRFFVQAGIYSSLLCMYSIHTVSGWAAVVVARWLKLAGHEKRGCFLC
jgi:hypothetical protein